MNYFIITGTSRGIGEAIARKLLVSGNTLFCISRKLNEDLAETASALHIPLFYTEGDLNDPATVEAFMRDCFERIDPFEAERIALINNAGMLDPVGQMGMLSYEWMEAHMRINFLAPAQLTSLFINKSAPFPGSKVILNISSGASQYPYEGWAMYCSSKAALDMLTRVTGMEQGDTGIKIFALAPGIVETRMQEIIRQTNSTDFPAKEKFVKLFEEGKLLTAAHVAEVIVDSLFNPGIPQGALLSLGELGQYADPHNSAINP